MTRKKNSFFTFCCSVVPGAGEMYMGFMKRGISLMGLFFLVIFIASWLNIESILLVLPIIWFFGFFDTHNLRAMPDDEFYALEDSYLVFPGLSLGKDLLQKKYRTILAWILIVVGVSVLWSNVLDLLRWIIPDEYYYSIMSFTEYIPQLLIGVVIIAFGIYLISGKKKELDHNSENKEIFKGGDNL